jgi:hypothetical protein
MNICKKYTSAGRYIKTPGPFKACGTTTLLCLGGILALKALKLLNQNGMRDSERVALISIIIVLIIAHILFFGFMIHALVSSNTDSVFKACGWKLWNFFVAYAVLNFIFKNLSIILHTLPLVKSKAHV